MLEDAIRKKAKEIGFDLVGITRVEPVERAEFPDGRGLKRPSEVLTNAKSIIVLGFVIWDEAMNAAVQARSGERNYYNFYREITEMLAWRVSFWLRETADIKAIPSNDIHMKVAAQLSGLGFIGRSTLVITPQYGPRVRWVTLLTDQELEPDQPFDRDLCAEEPLCSGVGLCIKNCPCGAIMPGPSLGVPPGEKVKLERCCIEHAMDQNRESKWEKHIQRISELAYFECTRCANICPYGSKVERIIIPEKQRYL
ncbi:MAG TPA: epoxyqueuosine reductase [Bacillota bacterium]|nr:epoxyqueuosine reductase [Bacillota bacterium]